MSGCSEKKVIAAHIQHHQPLGSKLHRVSRKECRIWLCRTVLCCFKVNYSALTFDSGKGGRFRKIYIETLPFCTIEFNSVIASLFRDATQVRVERGIMSSARKRASLGVRREGK